MKSTLLKVADFANLGITYVPAAILVGTLAAWMLLTLDRRADLLVAAVGALRLGTVVWLPTWLLTLPGAWRRRGRQLAARRAVLFTVGIVAVLTVRGWAEGF